MQFIEIKPRRHHLKTKLYKDVVRTCFFVNQKHKKNIIHLEITIGVTIAEQLNMIAGDYVNFFFALEDPKIWKVSKAEFENGYKLRLRNKHSLFFKFTTNLIKPESIDVNFPRFKIQTTDNVLLIYSENVVY